jgi:hypothetical protein
MSSVTFTSSPFAACASHFAMKRSLQASMSLPNSVMTRRWKEGCIMYRWRFHSSPSLVMMPWPSRILTRSSPEPFV